MAKHPVYDRQFPDQRQLGAVIPAPLAQQGVQPIVEDLGARNGFMAQPPARSPQGKLLDVWQAFPYKVRDLLHSLRSRMRSAGLR